MNWHLVSLAAAAPQPWRNGGGLTRELLAWPAASGWRVRVSVADVQAPGPFSSFAGVERWFAVLEGDGVVLRMADGEHRLTRASEPFCFDGGQPVDCALPGGPTRDFNLMAPPGLARLQRVRGECTLESRGAALLALYAHARPAQLAHGGTHLDVPSFHLAWSLHDQPLTVRVSAAEALWLEART